MVKKAYISIEGEKAKVFIPAGKEIQDGEFYKIELDNLKDFIINSKIKEVIISQFIPNLLNFSFPLPMANKVLKNKKVLNAIITSEIRKRYPNLVNFSFIYEPYESAGRIYLRCFLTDENSFNFLNNLIIAGVNIKANYPVFLPLIRLINEDSEKQSKILCFISGENRFLFVLRGNEMFLQRQFEGEKDLLTEEDVLNINMTVNYSIQTLRINPEKIIFVGIDTQVIEGLSKTLEFSLSYKEFKEYTIPICLFRFENSLKGKELLPHEYKKYIQNIRALSYVSLLLIFLLFSFMLYNAKLFLETKRFYEKIHNYKGEISLKEKDFFALNEIISNFEKNFKPIFELENRKINIEDIRKSIYPVSEASKDKQIEISSIDITNGKPQKLKIIGKVEGQNFVEKQTAYINFKNIAIDRGLKIINEKWDITKGEFTVEGDYDSQRVLQK